MSEESQLGASAPRESFSLEDARRIAEALGIDWPACRFEVEQCRRGLEVELEHGRRHPETDVTGDDELLTGKIALAHLREFPDYYTRREELEAEAKAYWAEQAAPPPIEPAAQLLRGGSSRQALRAPRRSATRGRWRSAPTSSSRARRR